MDTWQAEDEIVYRRAGESEWCSAGTLAELEREHRVNQRLINLQQLSELLINHIERGFYAQLEYVR